MPKRNPGISYQKRVADINRIYDEKTKHGIPNREIWRRFIYPVYGVSERTFYNILKAPAGPRFAEGNGTEPSLFDFDGNGGE